MMVVSDREAHVKEHSFKSGNVDDVSKQLKLKLEDDLLQIEKEETSSLDASW